jgi:hypothetical protein
MKPLILTLLLTACATEPNTRELLKHKAVVCVEVERIEYCDKEKYDEK